MFGTYALPAAYELIVKSPLLYSGVENQNQRKVIMSYMSVSP